MHMLIGQAVVQLIQFPCDCLGSGQLRKEQAVSVNKTQIKIVKKTQGQPLCNDTLRN